MNRLNRVAILLAGVLVVALAGTVLANRGGSPASPASQHADEGEVPDDAAIAHALERLEAADLDADEALVRELAAEHGIGGAIRIIAWAASGADTVEGIRAKRAEGRGWGEIAAELDVEPGIGWIMGNGGGNGRGLGRDGAPGQQRDSGTDD